EGNAGDTTMIALLVPWTPEFTVSTAVTDSVPVDHSVTANVPEPPYSMLLGGNAAGQPLAVNRTTPPSRTATFPYWSSAVTVDQECTPAVTTPGAPTLKWVAAHAGPTAMVAVPLRASTGSLAVMTW